MVDCCEKVAAESKVAGEICEELALRFGATCGAMDAGFQYIDYTQRPPIVKKTDPDGRVEVAEVMRLANSYANSEYVADVNEGKPIAAEGSFLDFLADRGKLPFWIVRSPAVWAAVKKRVEGIAGKMVIVNRVVSYLTENVTFNPIPDSDVNDADGIFRSKDASCLEWSGALFGLLLPFGVDASFAIRPYSARDIYHVALEIRFGDSTAYADPKKIGKGLVMYDSSFVTVSPEEAEAYFMSEQFAANPVDVSQLLFAHQIAPRDYHITWNLRRFFTWKDDVAAAERWDAETRRLTPGTK
jgi:hypothetical protein